MSKLPTVAVILAILLEVIVAHFHEPNNLLHTKSLVEERGHIDEHLSDLIGSERLDQMTEDELKFLYFKMHDDNNDHKLDGCELVKSLMHWHVEEQRSAFPKAASGPWEATSPRIFGNDELAHMIDPILKSDDKNNDGFIDYTEFAAAQKSRGF